MELLSVVVTLRPERSLRLRDNLSRAAHAWWLNQARSKMPGLADEWHRRDQIRPFTVSGLWRDGRRDLRGSVVGPEQELFLRLTALDKPTCDFARTLFLDHCPHSIRLDEQIYLIEKVASDQNQHPWAGTSSYDLLHEHLRLSADHFANSIRFEFSSHTHFQRSPPRDSGLSKGYDLPFPLPGLVIGSLLQSWNTFSHHNAPNTLDKECEHRVLVSSHNLRATTLDFGPRGKATGFRGSITYSLHRCSTNLKGWIHTLAAYALYAGVGGRTTSGLGQCRAFPGRRRQR